MMTATAAIPERCDLHAADRRTVRRLLRAIPDDTDIERVTEIFRALGDPTRTRILFYLSREELCVCDLAALLGMNQSAVSHQLRLLRQQRLVKYRREGKMTFYSADDDHISELFHLCLEHVQE